MIAIFGHEDVRAAIKDHLTAVLPTHLAAIRARRQVSTPANPVAYLLADSLQAATQYPVILIRSTEVRATQDLGDGLWATRYAIEIVCATEVSTAGAYVSASVDRDRLSEAIRMALLTPSTTLPDELTVAHKTLTETNGPAAETLVGRPLAVGSTSVVVVAVETMPDQWTGETIDATDLTTTLASSSQTL